MRALVVVNPTAGGGQAGPLWQRLEPHAHRLAELEVQSPATREEASAVLQRAVAGGFDRVVVVGGDGTVHLAVNELMKLDRRPGPTLGIVPAGTGSDLARALALPRRSEEALQRALLGSAAMLDVGCCESDGRRCFFANVASAGIGGLVDSLVNAMPNRGRTAFLRATLRALRTYRAADLAITIDSEPWHEGPVLLVAIANGTSFGKGMKVAPNARMDDGLFDVVLVRPVSGLGLLRRLPQVYLGRHLRARQVSVRRAFSVGITPRGPMPPLDLDGEAYAAAAARLTVLPAVLPVATSGGVADA